MIKIMIYGNYNYNNDNYNDNSNHGGSYCTEQCCACRKRGWW